MIDYDIGNYEFFNPTSSKKGIVEAVGVVKNGYSVFDADKYKSDNETLLKDKYKDNDKELESALKKNEKKANKIDKCKSLLDISSDQIVNSYKEITILDNTLVTLHDIINGPISTLSNTNSDAKEVINEAKKVYKSVLKTREQLSKQVTKGLKSIKKATKGLNKFSASFTFDDNNAKFVEEFYGSVKDFTRVPSMSTAKSIKQDLAVANASISDKYDNEVGGLIASNEMKLEDLASAITNTEKGLEDLINDKLKRSIKKEHNHIKRVQPKLVTISRNNLEKLKSSELLQEDFAALSLAIKDKHLTDSLSEKIQERFKNIKELTERIKDESKEKIVEHEEIRNDMNNAIDEAREAGHKFEDIVSEAGVYDREIRSIRSDNRALNKEISTLSDQKSRLEKEEKQSKKDNEVLGAASPIVDNSSKISDVQDKINERRELKKGNKTKLKGVFSAKKTKNIVVPEEYKHMKRKLEETSKLKEATKKVKKKKGAYVVW